MAVHVVLSLAFVLYSANAARIGSRGEFMRHREFNVNNETPGSDPEVRCRWVSMQTDRLLMHTRPPHCQTPATAPPFCSSQGQVPGEFKGGGCSYDDYPDALVDTLDLGTVSVDDIEEAEGGADGAGRFCATLMGCPSAAECRDVSFERHKWHLCVDERDTLKSWIRWIDAAYLRIHAIADRLPNMIESACADIDLPRNSASNNFSDINLPHALAPMLPCGGAGGPQGPAREAQVHKLLGVVAAFKRGTIAFRPGKTSRSGASFFFDRTKQYLAKRIRDFEYYELWRLTNSCDYSKWVGGSRVASTLNPIFLAFYSEAEGMFWEIMRVEQLPPGIVEHMPPKASSWRSDFFYDLKPSPMTSDLADFKAMLSRLSLSAHLDMASVATLKGVINDSLFQDFKFLRAQNLIDYSLLTYGTIFREDPDDAASREFFARDSPQRLKLEAAVNAVPGCGFGCSDRSFHVVDVTRHLDEGYVEHDGRTYKCCCTELQPGSVGALVSPCQLVDISTKRAGWGMAKPGCGSLVGYGVHNMFHDQVTRYLGGRCVVARGAPEPYLPAEALEVLESDQGGQRIAACGLFCLSVIDYLMPFNFWHKAENVVLAPFYGDFKWSRYDDKMRRLVRCLSTPPFPRDSTRLQAAFHDRSRFVPGQWLSKCEKEFEAPEGFDEPAIEDLKALTMGDVGQL